MAASDQPMLNRGWANATWEQKQDIIAAHTYFELGTFYYLANDPRVPSVGFGSKALHPLPLFFWLMIVRSNFHSRVCVTRSINMGSVRTSLWSLVMSHPSCTFASVTAWLVTM